MLYQNYPHLVSYQSYNVSYKSAVHHSPPYLKQHAFILQSEISAPYCDTQRERERKKKSFRIDDVVVCNTPLLFLLLLHHTFLHYLLIDDTIVDQSKILSPMANVVTNETFFQD